MTKYKKECRTRILTGEVKSIRQYIRNKRGHRIGILVAWKPECGTCVEIGWSQCKQGDVFDPQFGLEIAIGRACVCTHHELYGSEYVPSDLPYSLAPEAFNKFLSRCARYWPTSSSYAYAKKGGVL